MRYLILMVVGLLPASLLAQGVIDPAHKHAWSENAGFIEWIDADRPDARVEVRGLILRGYLWGENIGWIDVGDGDPSGATYSNTDGSDFGVNVDAQGNLSGLAWSENTGWISFDGGAQASPPNPARVDRAAGRLRGLAWSPNVGWINLDDSAVYVGVVCACERTGDGLVDIGDLLDFIGAWFAGDLAADETGDGEVTIDDLLSYISCWFSAPFCY